MLVEWNETKADYRQNEFIHQVFEAQAERTPDAIAIASGEQQITYGELNKRANQVAYDLQRFGVGPDVVVGLLMEQSIEMVLSCCVTRTRQCCLFSSDWRANYRNIHARCSESMETGKISLEHAKKM